MGREMQIFTLIHTNLVSQIPSMVLFGPRTESGSNVSIFQVFLLWRSEQGRPLQGDGGGDQLRDDAARQGVEGGGQDGGQA